MFKKTRWKIVAAVMASLFVVLGGTLALIYTASYAQVYAGNQEMLTRYAQEYAQHGNPSGRGIQAAAPEKGGGSGEPAGNLAGLPGNLQEAPEDQAGGPENLPEENRTGDNAYALATFYSAWFADDGAAADLDNRQNGPLSDSALTSLAQELVSSGKTAGTKGNFVYLVQKQENGTLVVLMDNTILKDSYTTLFRNTMIFGGAMLIVMLAASVYLSGRIVRPLEENDRRQKQFVSDAGHELKTPVSAIGANADLLQRETGENRWLSNIVFENNRMGELVRELLDLSRAEQVRPVFTETDLSRVVTGAALPLESIAFEHALTLELQVQDGISVMGSAADLTKLVTILTDNAICHAGTGTTVTVSLKREHRDAVLAVSNAGEPIPEAERERIFERFYRADQARSSCSDDTGTGGTDSMGTSGAERSSASPGSSGSSRYGLGLAIAKAIAGAHGSEIHVECRNGITTFAVRFRCRE